MPLKHNERKLLSSDAYSVKHFAIKHRHQIKGTSQNQIVFPLWMCQAGQILYFPLFEMLWVMVFKNSRCSNRTDVKTEIGLVCHSTLYYVSQWLHMLTGGCQLSQKKTLPSRSLCTPQGQERERNWPHLTVEFNSVQWASFAWEGLEMCKQNNQYKTIQALMNLYNCCKT